MIQGLFRLLEDSPHRIHAPRVGDENSPVIIYGMGTVGKDVFAALDRHGIPVEYFIDRKANPQDHWRGVPIVQPDAPSISPRDRKNNLVILAIFNAFVDVPSLAATLAALGYERVMTFLEFYDQFGAELGERFWLTPKSRYIDDQVSIAKGYDVWADDSSRALYEAVLKFRFTNDYAALPPPDQANQYFPQDIPPWRHPLRFVDCGAYDGDTLAHLLETNIPVEAIAAFEPDQNNFAKLEGFVAANRASLPATVDLFPYGVSARTKQMRFSTGQDAASHTSSSGDTLIQCVSLDEAVPQFAPNLIKMDIEGAEYDALLGAAQTIRKHRPGLAICVYHRPDDLWRIPLLVKQTFGGKLCLRLHNFSGFDLVMYCHLD